jgi:ribose 5-phosphate isomerase B
MIIVSHRANLEGKNKATENHPDQIRKVSKDFVSQAAQAIKTNVCDFGMGFCRTGQGVNLAANHTRGIRGALIFDEYMAEMARRHNCANFFSIPEKYVDGELLEKIIKTLIDNSFDGGRHMTRMKKTLDI